ncbi:hypothetical protein [Helicobacter sp. T3_23-1059]
MNTFLYNYSQPIFYIVLPLSIVLALLILRFFAYIQNMYIAFKYVNYLYTICFTVIYFLCRDLYIDIIMEGYYFSFDEPEIFNSDYYLTHNFYLAIMLKFYLGLMIGCVVFNATPFRAKLLVNTLSLIWCVILSWRFETISMFFYEWAVPSMLFFIEFGIWALLFNLKNIIRRIK